MTESEQGPPSLPLCSSQEIFLHLLLTTPCACWELLWLLGAAVVVGSCWPAAKPQQKWLSVTGAGDKSFPEIQGLSTLARGTGSPQCIPVLPSAAELSWIQSGDVLAVTPACRWVSHIHPLPAPWVCAKGSNAPAALPSPAQGRGSCPSSEQLVVVSPLSRCLWLFHP